MSNTSSTLEGFHANLRLISNPFVNVAEESHGTSMAGLIASRPNNSMCSVGVAFDVNLGAIRLLTAARNEGISDEQEAKALSFARQKIDIYVLGYGSTELGEKSLRELAKKAVQDGTRLGRGGKGNIFLAPGGNSGISQKSCSIDQLINSMNTIAINAMGKSGAKPFYAEECAAIMASAFSAGRYPDPWMVTASVNNSCTTSFSGTSSSVAVAGGVLALALQANPDLTWRDIQHLIVRTARSDMGRGGRPEEAKWITNAAGHRFSTAFGFGLLDASALVQKASSWSPVGDQEGCVVATSSNVVVVDAGNSASISFDGKKCAIVSVEHVLLVVNMTAYRRGDIMAALTSPSNSTVTILTTSRYDISWEGFQEQALLSLATWGEDPRGHWILDLQNKGTRRSFTLLGARLEIYGTSSSIASRVSLESETRETRENLANHENVAISHSFFDAIFEM